MRRLTFVLSSALAAVSLGAGPALAEGLPQLDATKYASQVTWLAITFVLLLILMAKVALPRINRVLEEREERIEDDLTKAEALKVEAQAAAEAYEETLAGARAEAQEILRAADQELVADASRSHEDLARRLEGEIRAGEARIAEARDGALANIRDLATEVARSAAERLTGETFDEAEVAEAVAAAVKERG